MTRLRVLLARLLGLFSRSAGRDRELRAEIDAHIAEAAEEFVRQGVPADEARRLAFAQFGGVTQTIEAHRERRRFTSFGARTGPAVRRPHARPRTRASRSSPC